MEPNEELITHIYSGSRLGPDNDHSQ